MSLSQASPFSAPSCSKAALCILKRLTKSHTPQRGRDRVDASVRVAARSSVIAEGDTKSRLAINLRLGIEIDGRGLLKVASPAFMTPSERTLPRVMGGKGGEGIAGGSPGRPFKKGVSGNPGGRPKVIAELRDLARQQQD